MIVMLSNNSSMWVAHLATKYPGKIGHLYSPGGQRGPWPFIPYALDNGRYGSFLHKSEWSATDYKRLLAFATGNSEGQAPLWCAVPDVVEDWQATLKEWKIWAPQMDDLTLAIVVQDGAKPEDIPERADVVFVGGSYEWKWGTLKMWCEHFRRVHVGRVNSPARLYECHYLGVESVDGTGWLIGGPQSKQFKGLKRYLKDQAAGPMRVFVQEELNIETA